MNEVIDSLVIDLDLSSAVPSVLVTKPIVVLLAMDVVASGSSVGLSLSKVGYRSLIF